MGLSLGQEEPKILVSLKKLGFIGSDAESSKVAKKLINALSQFLQNEVNYKKKRKDKRSK